MGKVIITDTDLATSARKWRTELLMMPVHRLSKSLAHMTLRRGIRYSEKVGELTGDIEIGPYSETRIEDQNVEILARELKTYFGSVVKKFSPNSVYQTIYGSAVTKGEGLSKTEITRKIVMFLASKIGASIDAHLFNAVRNANGTKTVDLFDGFDTITSQEITAGAISLANGNLFEFGETIDSTNAYDAILTFCRAANDFLQEQEGAKLFLPRWLYNAYVDDYKATTGAISYNDKFLKNTVEGFENITFVPMYQKKNSQFIQLTTKQNMLVGVNQEGEDESMTVEKHEAFVLQFIATLFFGTQFESINPERLLVGKLVAAGAPVQGGGDEGDKAKNNH